MRQKDDMGLKTVFNLNFSMRTNTKKHEKLYWRERATNVKRVKGNVTKKVAKCKDWTRKSITEEKRYEATK